MAKKDYAPKKGAATDNPFAALSGLGDLPAGPDHVPPTENEEQEADVDKQAPLRVLVDRKYRRGKAATIVTGFTGSNEALQALGKELKVACGVGGSVKEGEIIIQGDQRDAVVAYLKQAGYRNVKKSGG